MQVHPILSNQDLSLCLVSFGVLVFIMIPPTNLYINMSSLQMPNQFMLLKQNFNQGAVHSDPAYKPLLI